MIKFRKLT